MSDATRILDAIGRGDPQAAAELLPLVYDELRRLAAAKLAQEAPGQTLQPTALVHEAWLRLIGSANQRWDGRAHFFGAAAEAMRRILIDNARRKNAQRHGGGFTRVEFDGLNAAAPVADATMLFVHEALDALAAEDAPSAELVKLRFFVGFTNRQAAEAIGISERTAKRHWTFARAWLYDRLQDELTGGSESSKPRPD